jgi:hypothetical protein
MIKIVDHAGNIIKKGRLVRWQPSPALGPLDLYVRVLDVVEPTSDENGRFVFEVTMGIEKQKRTDGAIQFKDVVTVLDPEEELRTAKVLADAVERTKNGLQLVGQD